MLHDRQPGGPEERLHDVFVHASGRAENSGADVGNVSQFEQPLNGAIFAESSVQHGENDVDVNGAVGGAAGGSIGLKRNHRSAGPMRFWRYDNGFAILQDGGGRSGVRVSGAKVTFMFQRL